MSRVATLVLVRRETAGASLSVAAATGAPLYLTDSTDFDEGGGSLVVNGVTFTYSTVDHAADAVTLAESLPAGFTAAVDEPVYALSPAGYPVVEWFADVDLGDDAEGDSVPASIGTGLLPYFPEGNTAAGSSVLVSATPSGYVVISRPGQEPAFDHSVRVSDATASGVLGGIDAWGNTSTIDLSVGGHADLSADTEVDGTNLPTLIKAQASGLLAWGSREPLAVGITTNGYAVLEMSLELATERAVTLHLRGALKCTSHADARVDIRAVNTYSATAPPANPTASSPVLFLLEKRAGPTSGTNATIETWSPIRFWSAGFYKLRVIVDAITSSSLWSTVGEWFLEIHDAGTLALATEDLGYKPGSPGTLGTGGSDGGSTAPPATSSFTKTYNAIDTKWWTGGGTFGGSDNLYFGNTSANAEGNRKGVIWFPKATIQSDFSGATITKVELYLYLHSGLNNNTVLVGSHLDASSQSDDFNDVTGPIRDRQRFSGWDEGTGKWVTVTFDEQGWKNAGQIAGIILGPAAANSETKDEWAAGARGHTHTSKPKLKITGNK